MEGCLDGEKERVLASGILFGGVLGHPTSPGVKRSMEGWGGISETWGVEWQVSELFRNIRNNPKRGRDT